LETNRNAAKEMKGDYYGMALLRLVQLKSVSGQDISIPRKDLGSGLRYALGGTLFGVG
jgi:hypothetical protein